MGFISWCLRRNARAWAVSARLLVAAVVFPLAGQARVVRVEVTRRSEILHGQAFGTAGAYEKLSGRVWYAVKPGTPHNRSIVDLELAPRNAAGEVEFSADFFLLKPKDPARGNGAVLLEVPNRGQKYILNLFEAGRGSLDPSDEADFGDGFLLKQGYTIAWLGWQADIAYPGDFLRLYSPVAKAVDGSAITGLVRADFTPWEKVSSWPLGHFVGGLLIGGSSYPPLPGEAPPTFSRFATSLMLNGP